MNNCKMLKEYTLYISMVMWYEYMYMHCANHMLKSHNKNTITRRNSKYKTRSISRESFTTHTRLKYTKNISKTYLCFHYIASTRESPNPLTPKKRERKRERERGRERERFLYPTWCLEHHKIFQVVPCALPDISWKCQWYGLAWHGMTWYM